MPTGHLGPGCVGLGWGSGLCFLPRLPAHPLPLSPALSPSSRRVWGLTAGLLKCCFSLFNPKGTLELAKQVSSLPLANYNLLRYICK